MQNHLSFDSSISAASWLSPLAWSECSRVRMHTHTVARRFRAGLWGPCPGPNPGSALMGCVTLGEECHPSRVVSSSLKQSVGHPPPRNVVVRWSHVSKCPSGGQAQGNLFVRVTFPIPFVSIWSPQFPVLVEDCSKASKCGQQTHTTGV